MPWSVHCIFPTEHDKNDEFFVAIEKTLNGEATDYPFLKAEASKRIEILMGKNKEGK